VTREPGSGARPSHVPRAPSPGGRGNLGGSAPLRLPSERSRTEPSPNVHVLFRRVCSAVGAAPTAPPLRIFGGPDDSAFFEGEGSYRRCATASVKRRTTRGREEKGSGPNGWCACAGARVEGGGITRDDEPEAPTTPGRRRVGASSRPVERSGQTMTASGWESVLGLARSTSTARHTTGDSARRQAHKLPATTTATTQSSSA
jgi:hypothetical protein